MSKHKDYIGDSVYVEIDHGGVKLTTNNGYPDDPRNVIYMEVSVLDAFLAWLQRVQMLTLFEEGQEEGS